VLPSGQGADVEPVGTGRQAGAGEEVTGRKSQQQQHARADQEPAGGVEDEESQGETQGYGDERHGLAAAG
jgi:hypothetical protein